MESIGTMTWKVLVYLTRRCHVTWKVLEPTWKVLVLRTIGVGKHWYTSRDRVTWLRLGKYWNWDLGGDMRHACNLSFFRLTHLETRATCLSDCYVIWLTWTNAKLRLYNVTADRVASPAPKKPKLSAKQGDVSTAFRAQEFSSCMYACGDKLFCKFCNVVVVAGSYHQ